MRGAKRAKLPFHRRLLYVLALAQLPFSVIVGLLLIARGGLAMPGLSALAVFGALFIFFLGCCVTALPAWFILRMGSRPAWWKAALIPGSIFGLMMLGVGNYARRHNTGIEVETPTLLATTLLMTALLALPGGMIGAHMSRAHRKLARPGFKSDRPAAKARP